MKLPNKLIITVLGVIFFSATTIFVMAAEQGPYKYEEFYTLNREILENLRKHYSLNTRRKSIMNVGDSISESRAFMWQMRWQREGLKNNPKEGYIYIEKELSSAGNTTSEWGRKIIDGALEKGNPEFATIMFGTNDMLQGKDIGNYNENMAYIVDACLRHGTVPLLLTILPSTEKSLSVAEEYNNCLRTIAKEKKVPLFDVYKLFLSKGDWELLLSDGVHPTINEKGAGGYNIMDDVIFEVYKRLEKEVMFRKKTSLNSTSEVKWYKEVVKEFGIRQPEYGVGVETSMKRISYLHPLLQFSGKISSIYHLKSAKHEYEGFQIVVIPFGKDLKNVKIEFTNLINKKTGSQIDKANLKFYVEGFVKTKKSWPIPEQVLGWKPDPLLERELFDVEAKEEQPIWIMVYTPADTPAGRYEGKILIKPENSHPITIKLTLDVWDFTLPLAGHLRTPTTLDMEYIKKFYGYDEVPMDVRRNYYSFLLEHRIDPTSLYHSYVSPAKEDLKFCIERGLRTMTLKYLPPSIELSLGHERLKFLKDYTDFLRDKGWLDKAVVYVADEAGPETYDRLKHNIGLIRQACPDLKTMAGSAPQKELYGYIDIWDPIMADEGEIKWNRYIPEVCQARQRAGDEVMWYVAASPNYPYPNIKMDCPLVDARILFWITWKYGVTGFEYYYINLWGKNVDGIDGKKWPEVEWDSYSFISSRNAYNGDGMLIYPGSEGKPYSSVRLENIRDGIEDYECFWILKEKLDELIEKDTEKKYIKVIEETKMILEIEDDVVKNMREFTREPQKIIETRDRLSKQIEKLGKILSEEVR